MDNQIVENTSTGKPGSAGGGQSANEITLIGWLAQEPTFSIGETGLEVLSGSVRIQPVYQSKPAADEDEDIFATSASIFKAQAQYRNFVAFGADAAGLADVLHKGMRVQLTGRLQTRSYEVGQVVDGEVLYITDKKTGEQVLPRRKSSTVVITAAGCLTQNVPATDKNKARVKGIARNVRYNAQYGVTNFTIVGQEHKADGSPVATYTEITVWNRAGNDLATRVGQQLKDDMIVTAKGRLDDTGYEDKKTGIQHYTYGVTAYEVLAQRPKAEAAKPADEPTAPTATLQGDADKVAPLTTPAPAPVFATAPAPAPAFAAAPAF